MLRLLDADHRNQWAGLQNLLRLFCQVFSYQLLRHGASLSIHASVSPLDLAGTPTVWASTVREPRTRKSPAAKKPGSASPRPDPSTPGPLPTPPAFHPLRSARPYGEPRQVPCESGSSAGEAHPGVRWHGSDARSPALLPTPGFRETARLYAHRFPSPAPAHPGANGYCPGVARTAPAPAPAGPYPLSGRQSGLHWPDGITGAFSPGAHYWRHGQYPPSARRPG